MRLRSIRLLVMAVGLGGFNPAWGADVQRLLVVDGERGAAGPSSARGPRLLLVGVESGSVLAHADLGAQVSVAVSPEGKVVSVLDRTKESAGGERLRFYRAGDLKPLETGRIPLPLPRFRYQADVAADSWFAPGGREIVIPGPEPSPTGASDLADTVLNCLRRELDREGVFRRSQKVVRVRRCYGVTVLRTAGWPRVPVWNGMLGLLEVADLRQGRIIDRQYLGDDPGVIGMNPVQLEKAGRPLVFRVRERGVMIADAGRYAYYVPQHGGRPGVMKKIDLAADPPRVVVRGDQPVAGFPRPGAASGRWLFLVRGRYGPPDANGSVPLPSRVVQVFRTTDLAAVREFEVPVHDIQHLAVSADGRELYVLDADQRRLVVVDAATGRVVRDLRSLARHPLLVLPVPETTAVE